MYTIHKMNDGVHNLYFTIGCLIEMSIFDAYDQEFSSLSRDISKNLSEFRSAGNAGRHL